MNDFIVLMLTRLGLGVGATATNINKINLNIHNILGYDFDSIVDTDKNIIDIIYNNQKFTLEYKIVNSTVKNLYVNDK